jgi:hypothetical protein
LDPHCNVTTVRELASEVAAAIAREMAQIIALAVI